MMQLILDSIHQGSIRTGVSGNLVKLLLGVYSLAFDSIFVYQHYVAYPSRDKNCNVEDERIPEREALLGND